MNMLKSLISCNVTYKGMKNCRNIVCFSNALFCPKNESTGLMKTTDVHLLMEKKMKFYMKAYEDLFGITKLTEMHDKVIEKIQNKLQLTQEKRRQVQEEIFHVQKKLQEMQDILHKTSMGDDMYISVVTQVRELLKEQKRLQDIFSLYDQTEREHQTTLALAINNSQDHEKTYREKNKYISVMSGVIGGILGLLGSSINNWRHRKDIKNFAADISDQVLDLQKFVERLELFSMTGLNTNSDNMEKNNLIVTIKNQHEILNESIKSLQAALSEKSINSEANNTSPSSTSDDMLIGLETKFLSKLNNYAYLNVGLTSFTLFSVLIVAYFTKFS